LIYTNSGKSTGNVNTVHIFLTIVLPVLPLKWNLSLDKIDVVRFRSRLVNSNTIFNRNDVLLLRTYQHGLERYYHLCIIKRFLYIWGLIVFINLLQMGLVMWLISSALCTRGYCHLSMENDFQVAGT